MFTIKFIENDNQLLNYIHVFSDAISCKIYPNLGASMQQLSFQNIEIIEGIEHSEKGLESYNPSLLFCFTFSFFWRIENEKYKYKNNTHQLDINDSSFPNALHGLIFNQSFECITSKTENKTTIVDLNYNYDGTLKGFPFPFTFKISYQISHDTVRLYFTIHNSGDSSFPFGLGWHPYFYTNNLEGSNVSFSSESEVICNDLMILSKENADDVLFYLQKILDENFMTNY